MASKFCKKCSSLIYSEGRYVAYPTCNKCGTSVFDPAAANTRIPMAANTMVNGRMAHITERVPLPLPMRVNTSATGSMAKSTDKEPYLLPTEKLGTVFF
jgi:hypothetical protein